MPNQYLEFYCTLIKSRHSPLNEDRLVTTELNEAAIMWDRFELRNYITRRLAPTSSLQPSSLPNCG